MTEYTHPSQWLEWARAIQAIAQTGDTYAENEWQHQRYLHLMRIAADIVNRYTSIPIEPINKNFLLQTGYATPKVDLRGAVFQDNRILLVEEKVDRGWTMPGGWADVGERPSAGVEREVLEESGYHVQVRRLIGIYDANRVEPLEFYHAYKLVFLCEIVGGEAKTSLETTQVSFFREKEIPKNFAGERTQWRHIRDAFAIHHDSSLPVFFD